MSTALPCLSGIQATTGHKNGKNGNTWGLLEEGSIHPVEMNSELGLTTNSHQCHTEWPAPLTEDGRTKIIWKGVGGVVLVIVANLIILGNNVLIKHYEIDYVDMILLRSTVQIIILGIVVKSKGKILLYYV